MLIRAAEELGLDLGVSWMVGDMISDILAGINARCRGSILVQTGKGLSEAEGALDVAYHVADNLLAAADLILTDSQPAGDSTGSAPMETSHPLRESIR